MLTRRISLSHNISDRPRHAGEFAEIDHRLVIARKMRTEGIAQKRFGRMWGGFSEIVALII
jgi:hypothetical protein